jgi:hypothetical protein
MKLAVTELRHFIEDKRIVLAEDLAPRPHDFVRGHRGLYRSLAHCRPLAAGGGDLPHMLRWYGASRRSFKHVKVTDCHL